ncbi:histone-lysine N-methyltransferase SETD2 [Trichonephila clavipes]|nr:histone-lysine N-methyltransferase SETD2 [Trichonephila clavipes]
MPFIQILKPDFNLLSLCYNESVEDKESAMKPEKVKSRWRRSSELEIGEKSTLCPKDLEKEAILPNFEEPNAALTLDKKEYVALQENMYLFERKRTKRKKEVRRLLCECTLSKEERENGVPGCQDECLNRLLMIECGSRCATGEACSNKRFQKRLYAKVEPFKTLKKGWGLKLLEDVPIGNFVIEYVGEVLSRHDFKQRVKQYAREKSNHYYFMALKTDEIIDATNKGNLSRFMNHSCDPNCETQKWTVNGELRIGFFAKRDLKAGEELTFDYQFQRYGREAQKCYCESELCTGYIGVSKEISLDMTNKTINKRKKGSEEKKRDVLEDLIRDHVATVAEWYRYRIVACLVSSSSPVPLKTRRVGQRCTLNLLRAETSSRWCGS